MITAISRHLNVPVMGIANNSFSYGLAAYDPSVPYYSQPGALSERLLNLSPSEESVLTGLPIAEIVLTGQVLAGSSLGVSALAMTGSTEMPIDLGSYTPTPYDLTTIEPLFQITTNLALAINMTSSPYVATAGPHEAGGLRSASQASLTIQALTPVAFNVSLLPAALGAYVASQGTLPTVSQTFQEPSGNPVSVYGLVPICDYLESKIASASDVAQLASVQKVAFAQNEADKRLQVYNLYRLRLAQFFFGANGATFLSGGRRGRGAIA